MRRSPIVGLLLALAVAVPTGVPAGPARAAESPAQPFAVGARQLPLSRGGDRPLPTTLWYPATGVAVPGTATPGAPPAPGRFPIVLLSHGLGSLPSDLAAFGTRWAAAGFVVAAPAYPHTSRDAATVDAADLVNQPADGSYVISQVAALDAVAGDPLAGHLDTAEIAAAGHSGGGYTTVGMLTGDRDDRLRAAVVLSGGRMGGAYAGAPVPVLFVHGDADATVPYSAGRAAYDALNWPKAFQTLTGGGHAGYLVPGGAGFAEVAATTTDFLRWALYGDPAARARLAADATAAGVSSWESAL
jgi:dienelactone hydrolase